MDLRLLFLTTLTLAVVGTACDSGPNYQQYPAPLDLKQVSIVELRTSVELPGRYNINAIVVKVTDCFCPANAICIPCQYPEGVIVSESGESIPESGYTVDTIDYLLIEANDSEQFTEGQRYTFSVGVEDNYSDSRRFISSQLLGYRGVK